MKLEKLDSVVVFFNGQHLSVEVAKDKVQELTYRDALIETVSSQYKDEQLTGTQIANRNAITMSLMMDDEPEFKSEDISVMKGLCEKRWPLQIVHQLHQVLEGKKPFVAEKRVSKAE